ncbi:hypothetical protein A2U01_0039206 [Trifolium medium]|uniref:Uncharacterized protein n=1 Tax=Trifolium medium TaxID=97028 RepID=A0A392Q473_9FABA|nr:hypothetical protein [Trifolium medium]
MRRRILGLYNLKSLPECSMRSVKRLLQVQPSPSKRGSTTNNKQLYHQQSPIAAASNA